VEQFEKFDRLIEEAGRIINSETEPGSREAGISAI
jgi:hypothetical protein